MQTSFQPLLLRVFHLSDSSLSHLYIILGLLSLFPPVLVAFATRYIRSDRLLVLFGTLAKLFGTLLYLPPFTTASRWYATAAFVLAVKGTTFFTAASMSLLTKLLGPMCSPLTIAAVTGMANTAAVAVQMGIPRRVAGLGGTWGSVWIVMPAGAAVGLSMLGWSVMDEESEWTKRILKYVNEKSRGTTMSGEEVEGE